MVTTNQFLTVSSQVLIIFYLIQAIRAFQKHIFRRVNANETTAQMKLKEKSIMVIFGSGGHTTEMLLMLQNSNIFEKYGHVHFVFGHSDSWSL